MTQIMVVGANPAWQKVVRCERLVPGEVVRVKKGQAGAAGKGFNCAQAVSTLGECALLVTGIGIDGDSWRAACRDQRLEVFELPLAGEIRTATTVVDADGTVTEIVEEGPPAAAWSQEALEERMSAHPAGSPIALCGTFPEGFDPARIVSRLESRAAMVLVDSIPLARQILQTPVPCPGLVLKLNFTEWKSVTQHWTVDGVFSEVRKRLGDVRMVLTAGSDGAYAEDETGRRRHFPVAPAVHGAQLHPIGAGDAFTAGILVGEVRELPFFECCSFGSLTAQLSCRQPLPSRLVRAEVDRLWAEIA